MPSEGFNVCTNGTELRRCLETSLVPWCRVKKDSTSQ